MADSAIEWTEATWNPTTGCDRTSPGCDHCLAPDTPVLMADMSWRPIGKVVPGDELVGFTESPGTGQNRVYERATVVRCWSTTADAVELLVPGRSLVASVDHRFLARARPYWRPAERLGRSSGLVDIGMPALTPDVDTEAYLSGYLAGAVAGDGTFRIDGSGRKGTRQSYLRVAVLTTDQPILDRMARAFAVLGCDGIHGRPFDAGRGSRFDRGERRAPMSKIETRRMSNLVAVREACLERDDPTWKAGYLAGLLDTDGCYSGDDLRFSQTKPNDVLERARRYIHDLGFASRREDFRSASGRSERLLGNIEEKLRFLSTVQPALTRKAADFYGRRFPGRHTVRVEGVRRVGRRDLVDIETSSGTFIAAGLATHNCYALTLARRLKAMGQPKYQVDGDPRTSGPGFGLTLHPDTLDLPRTWAQPRTVFVNSMSDLFHEDVPFPFVEQVFEVMASTPRHQYQVLTKRSKRLARLAPDLPWPANVWMGVSVESDRYRFRVDHLREVPAAVRFLSCEPLLGDLGDLDLTGVHWVIAGGESGAGARPMDLAWVEALAGRCAAAGVPFFLKQLGTRLAAELGARGKGHDLADLPPWLRIREYPAGRGPQRKAATRSSVSSIG